MTPALRAPLPRRLPPRLDAAAESALAERLRAASDPRDLEALVCPHLPLVAKLATRFSRYGVPHEDLVQEGTLGLLRAVRTFDGDRGVRFASYAAWWIRAYLFEYVIHNSRIVRMGGAGSARVSHLFFRLRAERARLEQLLGDGHEEIVPMLAERFGLPTERIAEADGYLAHRDVSLDVAPPDGGGTTRVDLLRSDELSPEERAERAERDARVRRALARTRLDARERMILRERLLCDGDGDAPSLAALGRRMKLSRERVRQIERDLKTKLRAVLQATWEPPRRRRTSSPEARAA